MYKRVDLSNSCATNSENCARVSKFEATNSKKLLANQKQVFSRCLLK